MMKYPCLYEFVGNFFFYVFLFIYPLLLACKRFTNLIPFVMRMDSPVQHNLVE